MSATKPADKPADKRFSFNPNASVFTPQQPAAAVDAELLSNAALAELNPEFAAALAAGEELDEKVLEELALIALDEEIADLELEIEVDETN